MSGLRASARLYIAALALVAFGFTAFGLAGAGLPPPRRAAVALALVGAMTAAHMFPLHFGFRAKLHLDTAVIFATVLLFAPGIAMLAMGTGSVIAYLARRRSWDEVVFNSSQTSMQAGVGSALLLTAGWHSDTLRFDRLEILPVLLVVGLAIYLVNTLLVATIIGLQSGQPPLYVWYQSTTSFDRTQKLCHLTQLGLGLLGALVADAHLWALPLLLAPALVLYRSLQRHVQSREKTIMVSSQSDRRRSMKRFVVSLLIPIISVLALALPAQAGLSWCKADPIVELNGTKVQILTAIPEEYLPFVEGPIDVEVKAPSSVKTKLLFTDAGYNGHGERVSFSRLNGHRGERDGDEEPFRIRIKVVVPIDAGIQVPVLVTVIPDNGAPVIVEGTHQKTVVKLDIQKHGD